MGKRIIPQIDKEYHKLLCDGLLTINNFGVSSFHSWFQTLTEREQAKLFYAFTFAIETIKTEVLEQN